MLKLLNKTENGLLLKNSDKNKIHIEFDNIYLKFDTNDFRSFSKLILTKNFESFSIAPMPLQSSRVILFNSSIGDISFPIKEDRFTELKQLISKTKTGIYYHPLLLMENNILDFLS